MRRYRRKNGEALNLRRAEREHGSDYTQVFAAMWDGQGGRCYLCGQEMIRSKANVDHDHACCPPRRSCSACRRGLACHRCNALIGQVKDDPELLRRIAGNLESRTPAARLRIAAKPVQLEMTP